MARMSARNTDFYGNPIKYDEAGVPYDVMDDGTIDYSKYQYQDPRMPNDEMASAYQEKVKGLSEKGSGGMSKGAVGAASAAAQGGDVTDVASAGIREPIRSYAMGAGLALQTINTINKRKQQQEQNKYLAELQKVQARQEALNKLAQIGQNLRA